MRFLLICLALGLFNSVPASAFERLEGYFIATETCEAFQSKNKQTNPGNITTAPDTAYRMLGINKPGGDYFQVVIEDAPVTASRWVSTGCGLHVVEAGTRTTQPDVVEDVIIPQDGPESTDNLLTLSWQPAFCEIRSGKKECRDLNNGLLPHTTMQMSIHGLWPQPNGNYYCGVPKSVKNLDSPDNWHRLPAPEIDTETADELAALMPGFASFLHHHEWIKHGTCYRGAGGADEFYDDTLYLTGLVNASGVGELFFNNIGEEIAGAQIRAAFDKAFGEGSGDRVQIKCLQDGNRKLVNEIWLNLKGRITPETGLGELLLAADTTGMGCSGGIVDPAGTQ
ncbi:ribonuclease T2 family protein [Roseibium aggregatum]|nr:ribonuclease [Roseibium aggregatum]